MSRRGLGIDHAVLPYMAWLALFLIGPLFFVVVASLQQKGLWGGVSWVWSFSNYTRAFDSIYLYVLWSSFKLAAVTVFSCLVIGFPMAWFMARLDPKWRTAAIILVLMPFISNFVVRAYALKFLIGLEGPLNRFLMNVGWLDTPLFLDNLKFAVWFGMVTNYLPFAVLPIYVSLERLDIQLLETARDLGANSLQLWSRIVWPLSRSAVVTGGTLVFVPAFGEFVIPDLLGGAKTMYLGNLLADQFLKARDWPFGAALSVLMMIVIVLLLSSVRLGRRT
jgi:spermidine/putrescine transport system permease protein